MSSNHLLHAQNLSLRAGSRILLEDAEFALEHSEIIGLSGPSGSGKTQLIWSLIGLQDRGVSFDGRLEFMEPGKAPVDLGDQEAYEGLRGNRICLVPQNPFTSLDPTQRCGRQVIESLRGKGNPGQSEYRARAERLFSDLMLDDPARVFDAHPHELSGGQLQRVVLAMALINNPALIIADEPTTALDAVTQVEVLDLLVSWVVQHSSSLLLVTHDRTLIHKYCSRELAIRGKKIKPISAAIANSRLPKTVESAPEDSGVVLEVSSLCKTYAARHHDRVEAVKEVSFELGAGECIAVAGPSGSGKSTLGRMIAGLSIPDSGTVYLDGLPLMYPLKNGQRRAVQMVFQDAYSAMYPHKDVQYFLSEAIQVCSGRLPSGAMAEKVDEMLASVQLPASFSSKSCTSLSGGERQRLQLARALALGPRILVCDETVTGLDAPVKFAILDLLESIRSDTRASLLFITHDLRVVQRVASRLLVMENGSIVEQGPVDQIMAEPASPTLQRLIDSLL